MLTTRGPVFPQLSHRHPSHSWKTALRHGPGNGFYLGRSSSWGEHALAYFQQECCRARAAGRSPAGPTACSAPDWPTCLPGPRIWQEERKEQQHQRSMAQLLPTCNSACSAPIPSSASSRVFLRHYHQHFSSSQVTEDLLCPRDECTRAYARVCPPMCCKDCALQS